MPPPVIPTSVIAASPGPLTTHPIIDKVKGVFINEGGTLRKADEIYANAPQGPQGTNVEKIHQSVPDAQFLK